MEESVCTFANGENKMEGTATTNPGLQVSVSFGRFENDSLSWEKFSSFSPNKYLEEVEKCATPGSVAQKKAYFEAHYKKIAERKAELMDQEKQSEKKQFFRAGDQNYENPGGSKNPENDFGSTASNGRSSYEEDKHVTDLTIVGNEKHTDKPNEETVIIKECQTQIEEVKEKSSGGLDSRELEKPEEVVLVKEEVKEVKDEISSKGSEDPGEITAKHAEKEEHRTPKTKERTLKTDLTKGSKINPLNKKTVTNKNRPTRKDRTTPVTKKKPISTVAKAPGFSPSRTSKPTSMSISRSLAKKENVSSIPKTKNPNLTAGNKQVVPKSLHMSLSLDPSGSNPSVLASTRRPLIMERMGDKDIVKRAFKAFQNSYNQLKSSSDGNTNVPKQVRSKPTKASGLANPGKDSGGSPKTGGVEKKSAKANLSSLGLRSHEGAERRKEFSKNFGDKSNASGIEKSNVRTNPKGAETDVKNRRHSLDPKAKPLPGFRLDLKLSKRCLDKEGFQNEGCH